MPVVIAVTMYKAHFASPSSFTNTRSVTFNPVRAFLAAVSATLKAFLAPITKLSTSVFEYKLRFALAVIALTSDKLLAFLTTSESRAFCASVCVNWSTCLIFKSSLI